jgi:hypothetical protein
VSGSIYRSHTKNNGDLCGKEPVPADGEKNQIFCSMERKGNQQSENAEGDKGAHRQSGSAIKKERF